MKLNTCLSLYILLRCSGGAWSRRKCHLQCRLWPSSLAVLLHVAHLGFAIYRKGKSQMLTLNPASQPQPTSSLPCRLCLGRVSPTKTRLMSCLSWWFYFVSLQHLQLSHYFQLFRFSLFSVFLTATYFLKAQYSLDVLNSNHSVSAYFFLVLI